MAELRPSPASQSISSVSGGIIPEVQMKFLIQSQLWKYTPAVAGWWSSDGRAASAGRSKEDFECYVVLGKTLASLIRAERTAAVREVQNKAADCPSEKLD